MFQAPFQAQPSTPSGRALLPEWLAEADRSLVTLRHDAPLTAAVEHFKRNTTLRLVPVLDDEDRPIGAIYEIDIRRLLLNPFGHALLRNPEYGQRLDEHIRDCPIAETSLPLADILAKYHRLNGSEGMVLTRGGRLVATITNRALLSLAARAERDEARRKLDRARQIEAAALRFREEVGRLVATMASQADRLLEGAGQTASRSDGIAQRTVTVAAAAAQSSDAMARVADEGRALAATLNMIAVQAGADRATSEQAAGLAAAARDHSLALGHSTRSIDSVVQIISDIAGKVTLLAINSTIEAAHAGEAGHGFRVIANEIKQLAAQARNATHSIAGHVGDIRTAIDNIVEGQSRIGSEVGAIAQRAEAIEATVLDQRGATDRIADHVEEVAQASRGIIADIDAVGETAKLASGGAARTITVARELSAAAERLSEETDGFFAVLRSA